MSPSPKSRASGKPTRGRAAVDAPIAIGGLAREFGITTRTIRFYEARGLIRPARNGSQRLFGPDERLRLHQILRARNLGLTLEEIGEHLALLDARMGSGAEAGAVRPRVEALITLLTAKQTDLAATLKELRLLRRKLDEMLAATKTTGN